MVAIDWVLKRSLQQQKAAKTKIINRSHNNISNNDQIDVLEKTGNTDHEKAYFEFFLLSLGIQLNLRIFENENFWGSSIDVPKGIVKWLVLGQSVIIFFSGILL